MSHFFPSIAGRPVANGLGKGRHGHPQALEGQGLEPSGTEPTTGASIYTIKERDYSIKVSGSGQLRRISAAERSEEDGPRIQVMQPPGYARTWKAFLALAVLSLALAFAAHYLRGAPQGGAARR